MSLRVSTNSSFTQVLLGIRSNQRTSIRAQEQVASGRRILRPSDDPTGTTRALSLTQQLADVSRFGQSVQASLTYTDGAGAALENASGLVAEGRALLLQAMNGTLSTEDRQGLANQFDLIRSQLIEIGNRRSGSRYLFGGTNTSSPPWESIGAAGGERVHYRGNEEEQITRIGQGVEISVNLPGEEIFGKIENSGMRFSGTTGLRSGTTADEGTGYEYVELRHDSTDPGNLASVGVALVSNGSNDTLLNTNSIQIDVAAGTIRLGSGPTVPIPGATSPNLSDLTLENGQGGELHLDFSGFTGVSYSGNVTGNGSISVDGTFQALTFTETDLELKHSATGSTIHFDTTGVRAAGTELAQFGGTVNIFDTFQGVIEDIRASDSIDTDALLSRLNLRLEELDRNHSNVLVSIGVMGARSARLVGAESRLEGLDVQLQSMLSNVVDADFAEVALQMARSDQALQAAQASGARLIQTSLLNFL